MKNLREEDKIIERVKRIHMIGIGGSGMCPLAEILHSQGYILSGSDNNESDPLKRVRALGATVYMGHAAENLGDCELVVYSAAISQENPELCEARRRGIPTMERSHLLGALTRRFDNVIGVCGTHGKTTVTSMITQILYLNNLDPTAVIGGRLPLLGTNGRSGKSENMVCESCEFVDTFLQLSPDVSVLLNIDDDHLDYFKTMDNLVLSFHKFISMSHTAYINGDDALAMRAAEGIDAKVITFGLKNTNDFYADNITTGAFGYEFDAYKKGEKLGRVHMRIPGEHNVYNGLAAFAVAYDLGVAPADIDSALSKFTGAGRRFEFLYEADGVTLVDDYAHHPTEIEATLKAAKSLDYSRVIAIFQPFTFSRTALLKDEFIRALSHADKVLLTPIMGSREVNTYGIKSEDIAAGLADCTVLETFSDIANHVAKIKQPGDLLITMGGGDIYKAAYLIREDMQKS
ncbi:MAG: UDP-N-acetylmuramate--L-alanine ligase [Clostridia bacterium]|nr:UDP-N-acetylmuramate--L-alanine ligase [Clostridia bacterium]